MNPSDLTVIPGRFSEDTEYHCLLTGAPAEPTAIILRRMTFLPGFWMGRRSIVVLPLSYQARLAFWQYLRSLRPVIVFLMTIVLPLIATQEFQIDPPWNLVITLISVVVMWVLIGRFLASFEFVRLIRHDRREGTITIRFSSPELARKAAGFLVCPE